MNWQEVTQNVLTSLGGIGIIGFIVKKLFETYLAKNVDKYRSQLDKETDIFKHQLQLITQEHQIKYFKLHNDRAEVIKELYQKLIIMEEAMRSYMAKYKPADSDNEQLQKKASEFAISFFLFFHQNEIFFDDVICSLIKEIDEIYVEAWNKYSFHNTKEDIQIASDNNLYRTKRIEELKSVWDTINKKIPPIKTEIANQFRNLLGVIHDNNLLNNSSNQRIKS